MLPAAASLRNQGANKGATTAFLISTPESGVDSIAVTYALMDPLMTIIRPVAAFITGVTGGLIENSISYKKQSKPLPMFSPVPVDDCDVSHSHDGNIIKRIGSGVHFAVTEVWGEIAGWFFIGVLLAGCITALIPDDFMANWLGGGLSSMLIMLVVGVPIYICATASTPIAAALILKGVSPGAALVFLLVGPATNMASLSVLIGILGKKSTFRYLLTVSVMAVFFGLLTDGIYQLLTISPQAMIGKVDEVMPHWLQLISTLLLLAISVKPLWGIMKLRMKK